ncbi:MAG TPA: aminoglycoside phosphotransferase family protein [Thermoanaerobaculia bacterium]|nr:aminoglycoside phosphotransferase family protein [Thermoanaerobaculia bacterium]
MTSEEVVAALRWEELGAKPLGIGWKSERLDSLIALVTITGRDGQGDVIVKQHRPETDAQRSAGLRARYEYDVLRALRDVDPAFSVPRPLLVDEPLGAIVIERACGRALDELIREGKRSNAGAERLVPFLRRAGRWLRLMQTHTRTTDDPAPLLENILDRARHDLDTLTQTDWLIRWRRKRIANALESLARRVTSGVTGHHGDYWPGNIFLDDTRVEVIDFEGYRLGLPLEDVAYFLVQLDLLFPRFRRRLPRLRQAFLDGYFGGAAPDEDALRLFTLTKTLYALARAPGAAHVLPLRLWIRHMQRRIVLHAAHSE